MSEDKNKTFVTEPPAESLELTQTLKKTFVEPEISQPVDVLEATTFFQLTDSGATN